MRNHSTADFLRRHRRPDDVPAILNATACLGLSDALVADLLGIASQGVAFWVRGERGIPHSKHYALIHMVQSLCHSWTNGEARPDITHFKRLETASNAGRAWADLAVEELTEACGGEIPDDVLARGAEGGRIMASLIDKDVELSEIEQQMAEKVREIAASKARVAQLKARAAAKKKAKG